MRSIAGCICGGSLWLWSLLCCMPVCHAQTAATAAPIVTRGGALEFEVASVRENRSDAKPYSNLPLGPGPQFSEIGGHLIATNQVLLGYIVFAYKPSMFQIHEFRAQLPEWARSAHYDVQARVEGSPSKDELRVMMQRLLTDRFKLNVRHETRQVPVYALQLVKPGRLGSGLQVHPADDPECAKSTLPAAIPGAYQASCGAAWQTAPRVASNVAAAGRNVVPAMLAAALAGIGNVLDRPLVDETGLTDSYDFAMEFAPEVSGSLETAPTGLPFAEALREQLGLKLVQKKGSVDVLVIDHLERPAENER